MTEPLNESNSPLEATTDAGDTSTCLSADEVRTRAELEEMIAKGELSFVDVGLALEKIRKERLHRDYHKTFEAYCRGRWRFSSKRAYQVIGAAERATVLSTIVDTVAPVNEAQVRSLVGRPIDEAIEIWKLANSMAAGAPVTGRLVKQAIKQLFGDVPKPEKPLADRLERVLHSCRDLVEHLADTDLTSLHPKQKSQLTSVAEAVAELAKKAGCLPPPAESAKRSIEELIEASQAFRRQRPRTF